MRKVRNFLIDLLITLLIGLPFIFLCDLVSKNLLIDWLDIISGSSALAILLIITNILLAKRKREARVTRVVNTLALVTLVFTIIFGIFVLLEWLFPENTGKPFDGNWEHWFPVSISLSIFLFMQERRRTQSYSNSNELVVAAQCQEREEAESIYAVLEQNGIKAMIVEQGSPMYINSEGGAPLQVQVMYKHLQQAKDIIK